MEKKQKLSGYRRLKSIYKGMNTRSGNHDGYEHVTVCSEWQDSFAKFIYWSITNGYEDSLTIDRIDNSKGYEPKNCRWATIQQQANNKSSARFVKYKDEFLTTKQLSLKFKISQDLINQRLKLGWSLDKILTTDKRIHDSELVSLAHKHNIKYDTLHDRLYRQNMSLEKALTKKTRKTYILFGEEMGLSEISRQYGIHKETIRYRIEKLNFTPEQAVTHKGRRR